jgi:two-component system, OmpR family, response regulator
MAIVLVVEDEVNVRKLVSVNLMRRGYTVFEASNGEEALSQLRDRRPVLMLLDIKLPDFSGWEVLTRVARDPSIQAPGAVLVMTASLMDAYADPVKYPRVTEVLVKPFSTDQLVAAVKRALGTT